MPDLIVATQASTVDLERYRKMMHAWAASAGARPDDSSDAVQEAMIEAFEAHEELAGMDEPRRAAWLKTTTRRKVMDADRHRKRAKRGGGNVKSLDDAGHAAADRPRGGRVRWIAEPVADDTSPSRRAEINELRDRLLRELPEEVRAVCILILGEKRLPEEVAGLLGLTVEEVGLRAGSGLMLLRKMLKRPTKVRDARAI